MGGFSWLVRRPAAAGDPTHALFAAQSHSIVDNLVALFEHSRAWNCSNQEGALADINGSLNGRSAKQLRRPVPASSETRHQFDQNNHVFPWRSSRRVRLSRNRPKLISRS